MNCIDNHLPTEAHINNMLRVAGALTGLPIIEVLSGYNVNANNCALNHLTFDELLRRAIGVDACGKPAIRVKYISSCNYQNNCTTNNQANAFTKLFAFDVATKTVALVLNR